jgi:hypothetical protein
MTNYRLLLAVPAIILSALVWFFIMVRAFLRTPRKVPQCWSCGALKVRRSHSRRFSDALAAALLLSPYRCAGCRVRFYGLRILERHASRLS